jgi:hypothetical protein
VQAQEIEVFADHRQRDGLGALEHAERRGIDARGLLLDLGPGLEPVEQQLAHDDADAALGEHVVLPPETARGGAVAHQGAGARFQVDGGQIAPLA